MPISSHVPILRAGENCWRIERAHRFALLIDNEAYFGALSDALRSAQHSIRILGWHFDPRTVLRPAADGSGESVGALLRRLSAARPQLDIRVLIWDMALAISATRGFYPQRAREWFEGGVHFRLDRRHPCGACHHQKLVVVDDRVAFCSGSDIAPNRWDSPQHLDDELRRRLPSGKPYAARHAAAAVFDGAAAAAAGELARARWYCATGETLERGEGDADQWPEAVHPSMTDVPLAIVRTAPASRKSATIRENEKLHLRGIERARELIYLENQYFASPLLGDALAERLQEASGPEVLVVCPCHSPNLADRLTMDPPRAALIARLRSADRHGRFHVYTPLTAARRPVVVHSKISVIDDRLLRIGSANLSNRSLGFDTECDVAVDAYSGDIARVLDVRRSIDDFRNRLIAHHLQCAPRVLAQALAMEGSYGGAVRRLCSQTGRLTAVDSRRLGPIRAWVAQYHLGDPTGTRDSFRPWRRRSPRALVV